MKKMIFKYAIVSAFAAVAGYGVYTSQKVNVELSDMALANVEALASGEVIVGLPCAHVKYYTCLYYSPWENWEEDGRLYN